MKKYPYKNKPNKINKLIFVGAIMGIGIAAVDTIWAMYLDSFNISHAQIGLISSGLVFISLLTSILSTPFLEKYKETKILLMTMIFTAISYFIIAYFPKLEIFLILATSITILAIIRADTFEIIFRDNSKNKELNKKEGILYSLENLGWVIGPLIATLILTKKGMNHVFLIAGIIFLIAIATLYSTKIKNIEKTRKSIDKKYIQNLLDFIKNKRLRIPYLMSLGISFWWGIIYIYVPLFAIAKGVSGQEIGIFFSILVIPLVLTEFKVGKLSQKIGLKTFFIIGFLGLSIISLTLFIVQNIYYQLGLIILASFFVGCLEPTQEIFFFRQVTKVEEEKYFPTYKTSWITGNFMSQIIIAGILLFFSDNFSYLAITIFMVLFTVAATRIKQ